MNARCAGDMIEGCLLARILEAIFPNSGRIEIGLISPIDFVYEPSSFFLGIMEIIAFLHDGRDCPESNATFMISVRS